MTQTTGSTTSETALEVLASYPPLTEAGIAMRGVVLGTDGQPSTYDIPLTKRAQLDLSEMAEESRRDIADQTPLRYGPAVLVPPGHVMHVSENEAATLSSIISALVRGDSGPFADLKDKRRLTLLAVRFRTEGAGDIYFFRVADSLVQLKSARYFGLVRSGDIYDRLEPADVMLLRRTFDVVFVGGAAFFTQKLKFERAFGFLDELKAASADTFDEVTANLRIEGLDAMRLACTKQSQMMAKMASIRRSMNDDPDYAAAMTMDRLVEFVRQRDDIKVRIETRPEGEVLVYEDDVQHRFQLLKLLDDDYLHSVLTTRDYESGSKLLSETGQ